MITAVPYTQNATFLVVISATLEAEIGVCGCVCHLHDVFSSCLIVKARRNEALLF